MQMSPSGSLCPRNPGRHKSSSALGKPPRVSIRLISEYRVLETLVNQITEDLKPGRHGQETRLFPELNPNYQLTFHLDSVCSRSNLCYLEAQQANYHLRRGRTSLKSGSRGDMVGSAHPPQPHASRRRHPFTLIDSLLSTCCALSPLLSAGEASALQEIQPFKVKDAGDN